MDFKTRCIITDFKEGEDFSVPMSHIHKWLMDNIEDIVQGRYRFDGTYEVNEQQELKL
tara:strand:- start:819 stop:992 length:174 start_codon:yes stop_codon:yes gene_type:complete